jgi:hypothetical protein
MMEAMKSTPIVEMGKMGRTQALSERRDTKILIQAEKFLCMPNHPKNERFRNLVMGRLKRSSFIQKAQCLLRQNPELLDIVSPLKSIPEQIPWIEECEKAACIQTQVKGLFDKDEQNDVQRTTTTLFSGRRISTRPVDQSIH